MSNYFFQVFWTFFTFFQLFSYFFPVFFKMQNCSINIITWHFDNINSFIIFGGLRLEQCNNHNIVSYNHINKSHGLKTSSYINLEMVLNRSCLFKFSQMERVEVFSPFLLTVPFSRPIYAHLFRANRSISIIPCLSVCHSTLSSSSCMAISLSVYLYH